MLLTQQLIQTVTPLRLPVAIHASQERHMEVINTRLLSEEAVNLFPSFHTTQYKLEKLYTPVSV